MDKAEAILRDIFDRDIADLQRSRRSEHLGRGARQDVVVGDQVHEAEQQQDQGKGREHADELLRARIGAAEASPDQVGDQELHAGERRRARRALRSMDDVEPENHPCGEGKHREIRDDRDISAANDLAAEFEEHRHQRGEDRDAQGREIEAGLDRGHARPEEPAQQDDGDVEREAMIELERWCRLCAQDAAMQRGRKRDAQIRHRSPDDSGG
jgi:hypothetical protein